MNVVKIECPSCGGKVEMEKSREFGFCVYCGTKIYIPNAIQKIEGKVSVDNSQIIGNYMLRARQFEAEGKIHEAAEYYNKVLDLDATHQEAQAKFVYCDTHITENNLFVKRINTGFGGTKKAAILIDGEEIGRINIGEQISYMIPCGKHTIAFRLGRTRSNVLDINIPSWRSRVCVVGDFKFASIVAYEA